MNVLIRIKKSQQVQVSLKHTPPEILDSEISLHAACHMYTVAAYYTLQYICFQEFNYASPQINTQIFLYKKIFQLICSMIVISQVIRYYKCKVHEEGMVWKKEVTYGRCQHICFNVTSCLYCNYGE
jgi:hypothetical protein